jgi:hypothetical protein
VDIEETQDLDGDFDVSWVQNGEWLQFTANVTGGYFDLSARVASANVAPGDLRVSLNGSVLGTLNVTNTADWQNWVTVTLPNVPLVGGTNKVLRLEAVNGGAGDQFNLNWIQFAAAANPPGLTLAVSSSGGQFVFNWPTVPGWSYQVESKTNLTQAAWQSLGVPVMATGNSLAFTNSLTAAPESYFRVKEQPQ